MTEPISRCRNCDTPLNGEFCTRCGQREGRGDLHFTEAMGDIVGDVFTWDSRLWRTLVPLLFRPGYLSAEFNAGRRARYMPPFRLYIVISFVLFLLLSLTTADVVFDTSGAIDPETGVMAPISLSELESLPEEQRERVRAALERAQQAEAEVSSAQKNRSAEPAQGEEGEAAQPDPAPAPDTPADPPAQRSTGFNVTLDDEEMDITLWGDEASKPAWVRDLELRMEHNAARIKEDPSVYVDMLMEFLPQTMFFMLPIFALLLKVLYLFSPFHYLQHLVFALHYHASVYLVYLLSWVLERFSLQLDSYLVLLMLLYLPLALRKTYRSGWGGAVGKSLVLYLSYFIVLMLGFFVVAIAALAVM